MVEADYIVLAQNAAHFEEALRFAVGLKIPAVKAAFVNQCISDGALADPDEFSFDGETVRRKRGAPFVVNLTKMRQASRDEQQKKPTPTKAKRKTERKAKQPEAALDSSSDEPDASEQHEEHSEVAHTPVSKGKGKGKQPQRRNPVPKQLSQTSTPTKQRSPTPTPPLITGTALTRGGRNLFVPEEKEYWPRYVAHVLKYEPETPTTHLANALARKVRLSPRV